MSTKQLFGGLAAKPIAEAFKTPKTPTLPTVEKIEPVTTVTDEAERRRQRIRRTATGRQSTLQAGIANALKRRLGE